MRDTYTSLRLVVDRLQIEDEEHAIEGKILVRAPCYPRHMYGDEPQPEEKTARAWIQICRDQAGDRPAVSMEGDTLQSVVFDKSKTNEAQPRSGLLRMK